MDHPNQKSYFQKNRLFHKFISKNNVNIGNIFSGKNALFLKSINKILIRDQLNYQQIVMKDEENRSMMLCAIWYHFQNLKNVKNSHEDYYF